MQGFGRYAVLHEAHRKAREQTRARAEARVTAKEITDRKAERRDRDQAVPRKAELAERGNDAAPNPAQPDRPLEAKPRTLVPSAPAPGESEGHFAWRQLVTRRIEKEQTQEAARKADEIPRIWRTEKDPISRRTELQAAYARLEAEQARKPAKNDKEKELKPENEIEPER